MILLCAGVPEIQGFSSILTDFPIVGGTRNKSNCIVPYRVMFPSIASTLILKPWRLQKFQIWSTTTLAHSPSDCDASVIMIDGGQSSATWDMPLLTTSTAGQESILLAWDIKRSLNDSQNWTKEWENSMTYVVIADRNRLPGEGRRDLKGWAVW